jgi:hypothetical protein
MARTTSHVIAQEHINDLLRQAQRHRVAAAIRPRRRITLQLAHLANRWTPHHQSPHGRGLAFRPGLRLRPHS